MTIEQLKILIFEECGMPERYQRLYYKTRLADESRTISEYGIDECSILQLDGTISGGGSPFEFADLDKETMTSHQFGKHGDEWRIVCKGLNLEGVCENSKCRAFSKDVIAHVGFTGDFGFDCRTEKVSCPICSHSVTPLKPVFVQCSYRFVGKTMTGEVRSCLLRTCKQDYDTCEEGAAPIQWERLVLHASDPEHRPQTHAKCTICRLNVDSSDKCVQLSLCAHWFHQRCLDMWTSIADYCPFPCCMTKIKSL